ncbi:MAG TPA: type II secretion system F family protein [Streptosporangiaceae bacterium]
MSGWVLVSGLLVGLGCWLAMSELLPAAPSLRAAVGRLDTYGGGADSARIPGRIRLGSSIGSAAPWLPVPAAELRLLGQDPADWLASKAVCGVLGTALPLILTSLLALGGRELPWTVPVGATLALGVGMFFLPDLVTRVNAREKRSDFRQALTSYLDLVALERGAGAAPTEALEAAAAVGGGWAFQRIAAALDQARKSSRAPWDGLAQLAAETGITELADLAEIAGVAGQEGAKILDTLGARAESMRAEALAAARARASARSTTMVLPIALLAGGFLVLLIFPDFYRLFG